MTDYNYDLYYNMSLACLDFNKLYVLIHQHHFSHHGVFLQWQKQQI